MFTALLILAVLLAIVTTAVAARALSRGEPLAVFHFWTLNNLLDGIVWLLSVVTGQQE